MNTLAQATEEVIRRLQLTSDTLTFERIKALVGSKYALLIRREVDRSVLQPGTITYIVVTVDGAPDFGNDARANKDTVLKSLQPVPPNQAIKGKPCYYSMSTITGVNISYLPVQSIASREQRLFANKPFYKIQNNYIYLYNLEAIRYVIVGDVFTDPDGMQALVSCQCADDVHYTILDHLYAEIIDMTLQSYGFNKSTNSQQRDDIQSLS